MRKVIKENLAGTMLCSAENLEMLQGQGYKYVRVRGLTIDKHYDYVEPYYILLVPLKVLPPEQEQMDIYEPIGSELLQRWLAEENEYPTILLVTGVRTGS